MLDNLLQVDAETILLRHPKALAGLSLGLSVGASATVTVETACTWLQAGRASC